MKRKSSKAATEVDPKTAKMECPYCGKMVVPDMKMFHTAICPSCSKILYSDYPMSKAGI